MGRSVSDRIRSLKRDTGALILAHYYQRPEIQDIADFLGDSLALSIRAAESDARMIVFCGVYFMAEQAAVLADVPVYIPDSNAVCPLARMLKREHIERARRKYPSAPLVLYVNSRAIHKALADYVVTSANAADLIAELDDEVIIFGPDRNLAEHVAQVTGKTIIPIPPNGYCYVHVLFRCGRAEVLRRKGYTIIVHPECMTCVRNIADFVGSTRQMYRFIEKSPARKIAVGTEVGFVARASRDFPEKEIVPLDPLAVCRDMKKITLGKILRCLAWKEGRVLVEPKVARRVRRAIERTKEVLAR